PLVSVSEQFRAVLRSCACRAGAAQDAAQRSGAAAGKWRRVHAAQVQPARHTREPREEPPCRDRARRLRGRVVKKLLLNRWTFAVLGLVLLLAVIWLLGPYFAFGSARPMESVTGRVIATLILLLVWVAAMLWRTWRETRGSRKLVAEVTQQADAPMVGEARPTDSADVSQLRQRFDDAVTRLKKDRRGGGNLYRLPWY